MESKLRGLLVITQKVDKNDSNLGFFHGWLEKLAHQVDKLYVICLQKGEYYLPSNVVVLSLGKEEHMSRLRYVQRFYQYIFRYKNKYSGIFVHMNPEYAILGGIWWRMWHKKILLWYTHKAVNWRLRFAEKLVNKIFTASKESFRLPSSKVEVVGHGIDVDDFAVQKYAPPADRIALLTVGRITPAKHIEILIRAVGELIAHLNMISITFDIVGEPILASDVNYKKHLIELIASSGLTKNVFFLEGITHGELVRCYQTHHVFLHASSTGSLDKAVLESLASGRIAITSSTAYQEAERFGAVYTFPASDATALAQLIEKIYTTGILSHVPNTQAITYMRQHHNLDALIQKIVAYFNVEL